VDAVVLQRPEEIDEVVRTLGRVPGVDLPAVFVEHNTPKGNFPYVSHPLADQSRIPVVHVTHFNRLAWDNGSAPTTVIEHGIPDPGRLYTGELPELGVVVNEPVRRGRVTGTDLLPAFASVAPLQVFGMKTGGLAAATGIDPSRLAARGDLKTRDLHRELARCRVYIHPMRWTSLGLSLLEAMHLGMPVVVLAATEAPRAVPPEAGAVSADVDELLSSAARLVANPDEARRRGVAAREAARERYGLGRFQDRWDELLADLRSRPRHSANERPDEPILVPARERNTP
jgi:glycosyltransferase involved in cell wall biosynthesis